MAITIVCGKCGRSYTVNDSFGGQTIACPNCKGPIEVPVQAAGAAFGEVGAACVRCGTPLPADADHCQVCGMVVVGRVPAEQQRLKAKSRVPLKNVLVAVVGLAIVVGLGYFLVTYITGMGKKVKEPSTTSSTVTVTKKELPPARIPDQAEVEAKFKEFLDRFLARRREAARKTRAKVETGGALPTSKGEWGIHEFELTSSKVTPRKDDALSPYSGEATFIRTTYEFDEESHTYRKLATVTVTREYSFYLQKGWSSP